MKTQDRMKAVLADLDFDFADFEMERFVAHIENLKGRKIHFAPWKLPIGMYGAWISVSDRPEEFVFFDQGMPPLHQVHTQLHELAHIINDHPTERMSTAEMAKIRNNPDLIAESHANVSLRSPNETQYEDEAEILAALIQKEVIHHERMHQLAVAVSSDKGIIALFSILELI